MKAPDFIKSLPILLIVLSPFIYLACDFWEDDILVGSKESITGFYRRMDESDLYFEVVEETKYVNFSKTDISLTKIPVNGDPNDNDIEILIKNVTVESKSFVYEVEKFELEECDNNCGRNKNWKPATSEDSQGLTDQPPKIIVTVVLDVSNSLGNISDDVKRFSKEFVSSLFSKYDSCQISLVTFARNVNSIGFKREGDLLEIEQAIDNFGKFEDDETKLLQAVSDGLELTYNNTSGGRKFLIIFTDGRDTDSDNPGQLRQNIKSEKYSEITRFVIGLEGKDFEGSEDELKFLASDEKKNFEVIKKSSQLKDAFDFIKRQVGVTFDLRFVRSDAVGIEKYYRFIFKKLKPVK